MNVYNMRKSPGIKMSENLTTLVNIISMNKINHFIICINCSDFKSYLIIDLDPYYH